MKCVIPNQNVKIIARGILSLSKIGDDLFIEPVVDAISFRTVNMAQSAFAEFKMNQTFFSSFSFADPEDCDTLCKVTMRSCVNIFKNLHNLDKQIENCEIRMKPDSTVVIFQLKFTNAPVKKYYLPIIDSEKLDAHICAEGVNQLTASSKVLMSTVKNFRYSEDEITITVDQDKAYIKNHLELKKDMQAMRTELCFHPSEFENYTVTNPACITFCFKELRAVLSFADPSNLSVSMCFSSPGMPIVFQTSNLPSYEANYVVSTLNANTSSTEMNLSRHLRTVNRPNAIYNLNSSTVQETPCNFVEESEHYNIQQDLSSVRVSSHIQINNLDKFRIDCNQEHINFTNKSANIEKTNKKHDSNKINSPILSDGIDSGYSLFDSDLCHKKSSSSVATEKVSPDNCNNSVDLVKLVFARCFRNNNVLKRITRNDIVIADVSDTEETV